MTHAAVCWHTEHHAACCFRWTPRCSASSVVSCEIVDARDKLVATAVETMLILPGRPWERPVVVGDEVPMEPARAT